MVAYEHGRITICDLDALIEFSEFNPNYLRLAGAEASGVREPLQKAAPDG